MATESVVQYYISVIFGLLFFNSQYVEGSGNSTSHRMIYYLNIIPRTWNEAKILCSGQDATLLIIKNDEIKERLEYLDIHSEWNREFESMLSSTPFWIGLYEDNSTYFWEGCSKMDNWQFWGMTTPAPSPKDKCVSINNNFIGSTNECNLKQPFICQRYDGECWFDPIPFNTTTDGTTPPLTVVEDEADCAQLCRKSLHNTEECWAFSYDFSNKNCFLHYHADFSAYIKPGRVLKADSSKILYTKMCFEGVKRADNRTLNLPNPTPLMSSCQGVTPSTGIETEKDVCYCGCEAPPTIFDPELEADTLDDKVEAIQKELTVDVKNTSSSLRKLTSATDDRPSAQSIGYVGVAFMAVVFGGIVLLDFNLLVAAISDFYRACKSKEDSQRLQN